VSRRFLEYYLFCVVGAALVTIGVAYIGWGMTPETLDGWCFRWHLWTAPCLRNALRRSPTIPAFRSRWPIKAKYLVAILIFIVLISRRSSRRKEEWRTLHTSAGFIRILVLETFAAVAA